MNKLELSKRHETKLAFLKVQKLRCNYCMSYYDELEQYILSDKCNYDLNRLIAGDYFLSLPTLKLVRKDEPGKFREVYVLPKEENMLLKLISFSTRIDECKFPESLYSFRSDKGGHDMLRNVKALIQENDYYIFKCDVKSYVNSLDEEILAETIRDLNSDDPGFADFCCWLVLRRKCIRNGVVIENHTAGLGGMPLSNYFMNIYLMTLDRKLENSIPLYGRYGDDIAAFCESEEQRDFVQDTVQEELLLKKLFVNPKKTYCLGKGETVELLGMDIKGSKITLCKHSIFKLKRKMRRAAHRSNLMVRKGEMSREDAARKFIAYYRMVFFGENASLNKLNWKKWSFPIVNDISSFKVLDAYIQHCLRFILSGRWGQSRYCVKYGELKTLGYKTIVHTYYHNQ